MVRIAIAGGTGGLGRTLVDELSQGNDHEIFVLSRKSELPFQASKNVHCLTTSYDDVDSLANVLKRNEIHTIISTVNPPTPEVHDAQENLIRAAAQSNSVKRFIPSEWGIDYAVDDEHMPIQWKALKQRSIKELKKHPSLEYTMVYNGYFLDYFGMPHCPSHMMAEGCFIDIAAKRAAIPGSGDDKVVFTYTKDVAKYVRKMVESTEKWPTVSHIVGDNVTFNEILETAERVRSSKFDTVHDSLENLRAGKVTEIPAYTPSYQFIPKDFVLGMMAGFGVAMITGVANFEGEINEKYPDIQPVKMQEFIRTYWEGK